jgi:hypothetical protein
MIIQNILIKSLAFHLSYFRTKKETKRIVLYSFCLFCLTFIVAQHHTNAQISIDSTSITTSKLILDSLKINKVKTDSLSLKKVLEPKIIARHSAILPGWGHVQLKQYWAPPIIYGGFAFAGYNIIVNNQGYRKFVDAYLAAYSTKKDQEVDGRSYNIDRLRIIKDGYRRNRELSYFSVVGIWAAQIVLANVTAHLRTFDISEDISMEISPSINASQTTGVNTGLKLTINF